MVLRFAAAVLVAALLLTAPASSQQNAYRIGVTFPLTGPLVTLIAAARSGAEVAVDEINKSGGVKGHPLQLVFEDSLGTPEGGIAAMRKLVQVDGVQAIMTIFTNVVTAQIPLADQLKVPAISTIESPGILAKSQYSFAHTQTVGLEAPLLRDFWKQAGFKRVYAFLGNNAYGKAVEPTVRQVASEIGAQYDVAFFDLNQTDYRGVIAKAQDFKPDVLFVAAQGSTAETSMIRQLREQSVTTPMFDPSNYYQDKSWRAAVGPYAEGMYFAGLNITSKVSPKFVAAFHAKTGYDPTYIAAEWYDIVHLYAAAIAKAGYNGEAIRNVIATTNDVPSVFGGKIVMGTDHYSTSTGLAIWQIKGGQLIKAPVPKHP